VGDPSRLRLRFAATFKNALSGRIVVSRSGRARSTSLLRIAVMRNENGFNRSAVTRQGPMSPIIDSSLHPAWSAFIRYCAELQHGEIAILKIQDGLPALAEVTRKKVKFAP
jgi:hypothetical protein